MVDKIVSGVKNYILGMSPFTDNSIDSNVLTIRQSLWKFARHRNDLTIEECSRYLSCGWEYVQERSKQALILQLCDLLTIMEGLRIDGPINTSVCQSEITLRECYSILIEQNCSFKQISEQSIILQIYKLLIASNLPDNGASFTKLPHLPNDAFEDVILNICSGE